MGDQSIWLIAAEAFAVIWVVLFFFSRHVASEKKKADAAKYAVWDAAYKQAIKAGKTEYYALMDAAKAVGAGPKIFKVWEDTYNAAINKGARKYSASLKATKAARKAAHN